MQTPTADCQCNVQGIWGARRRSDPHPWYCEALAAVTAESIRLILGTVPRVAGWAEPDADRCASCGHLPGCDCPEDCSPRGAAL